MNSLQTVTDLMEMAAITAPKAVGKNYVVTRSLNQEECRDLADKMVEYGNETGKRNFDRDAAGVAASGAVVLVGIKDAVPIGVNCAACGEPSCLQINRGVAGGEFLGPQCLIRILDMGIAIGSAVKTAQMLNVDNRIMYRIGVVARKHGYIDADFVMGIPLSVSGKNVFFDR